MDQVSKAVARMAAKDPFRPAVIDEVTYLTYGSLHERADRLAYALRRYGIVRGQEIMILLPNRADFALLLLAAVRAEAVPLILNTGFTSGDLEALASGTNTTTVVTSRDLAVRLQPAASQLRLICIEDVDVSVAPEGEMQPSGGNADVVFFTSGTTGRPKGAVVPRKAFNAAVPHRFAEAKPQLHLLCRPLFFRAHLTALCHILQEGNTVVLARQDDPSLWMSLLDQYHIPFVSLGPSDLHRWLQVIEAGDAAFPASVKHVMTTGAPLSKALKRKLQRLVPGVNVTDLYGTSETGAIAMIDREEWESKPGSCGRPLFFNEVRIVNAAGRAAAAREPGEIWVRSPYRMKEYYRNPEATAKTCQGDFIRTGDVGYLDEQGYLYLSGRSDNVINCAGFQVLPEEVENVLREHPNVEEAVVIGWKHPERTELPLAFIRLTEPNRSVGKAEEETAQLLLSYCTERLAGYKVPAAVLFIRDIPLNTAGKTDCRELLQRAAEQSEYHWHWRGVYDEASTN